MSAEAREISWDAASRRLSADVKAWPLNRVLETLSEVTGWTIYVDPEAEATISTRFRELPSGEALRRLLGDMNFALLPQPDGPPSLSVFSRSASEATERILIARVARSGGKPIPNELIIRLTPGFTNSIETLARELRAEVVGKSDELNAYRLRFKDETAANQARTQLGANEDGVSSENNYEITRPPSPQTTMGTGGSPIASGADTGDASHIVVAILDMPISTEDPTLSQHLLPELAISGPADEVDRSVSHGTAMAKTILRGADQSGGELAAANIQILPVDVYGNQPSTTTFDLVRGLQAAAQHDPDVVSMSLGSDGESPLLREAILALRQQGTLVLAAAGNEPTIEPMFPAAFPEVLAVTAGNPDGTIAHYANRGEFVDLVAPGTTIVYLDNQPYLGTGTSYATAYMSGVAASLAGTQAATPREVEALIRERYGRTVSPPPQP